MTVVLFVVYLSMQGDNIRSWEFNSLRACEMAAEFVQSKGNTKAVCIEDGKGKEG